MKLLHACLLSTLITGIWVYSAVSQQPVNPNLINIVAVGYDIENNAKAQQMLQEMAQAARNAGATGEVILSGQDENELSQAMEKAMAIATQPPGAPATQPERAKETRPSPDKGRTEPSPQVMIIPERVDGPQIVTSEDHTEYHAELLQQKQAREHALMANEHAALPEKPQWMQYAEHYAKLSMEMQARERAGMTPEQLAGLEQARWMNYAIQLTGLSPEAQARERAALTPEQLAALDQAQWMIYAMQFARLSPEMQARQRAGMTPEQLAALEKARASLLK